MNNYKDLVGEDGNLSLVKLVGMQIKDIRCYLSKEHGDVTIILTEIEFETDSVWIGGEHDSAFIESGWNTDRIIDQEELDKIYKQDPYNEEETPDDKD